MKLKSLNISLSNYDADNAYHPEPVYVGSACFSVRGNNLEVRLPIDTIQDIVRVISGTVLVACEVVGPVEYQSIETAASDNLLEHSP